MKKIHLSEEELKRILKGSDEEAKRLLADPDRWKDLKEKLEVFIQKAYHIPLLGSVIDDFVCMVQLTNAYVRRDYTDVPRTSMLLIAAALIYMVSPIDVVPDFIPAVGHLDDASVIILLLNSGVSGELEKFREWQGKKQIEEQRLFGRKILHSIMDIIEGAPLAAMILGENGQLRVLSAADHQEGQELPIQCRVHLLNLPVEHLSKIDIESEVDYLEFLNEMLSEEGILWSAAGRKEVISDADSDRLKPYFLYSLLP